MHKLTPKDIIEKALVLERDPKGPAVIAFVIGGISYRVDKPEMQPYLEKLCIYFNQSLTDKFNRALESAIPITGFYETEDI